MENIEENKSDPSVALAETELLDRLAQRLDDLIASHAQLSLSAARMSVRLEEIAAAMTQLVSATAPHVEVVSERRSPRITQFARLNWSELKTISAEAAKASYKVRRMSRWSRWGHSFSSSQWARNFARGFNKANADKRDLIYSVQPLNPMLSYRRRIMHAIPNVFMGGSTQLIVDLVTHLGHKYNMHIMTSAFPLNGKHEGLIIHDFGRDNSEIESMLVLFGKFQPEVIHVHYWGDVDTWWYDRVFEAARRFGVPVVQNINTPVAPYSADAEVVYVSRYVQEEFPSSVGRQRERVIYPGIDLKAFDLRPLSIDALDSIGMVYRLEHDKLNLEAIDPFIEVVRRRPRTRVIIVGGGSLLEPFREKVRVAGLERNFWFTGYVPYDELPGLYEQFSIFVAPVWKESFGQVTPFAMNMGRAVAGYDIGALSEILEDGSCLGHNTQELVEVILSLLADPERIRVAAERNREHARTKFSVEGMIEAYDRLYEGLLGIENVDPLAAFPPATLFPR